ncbi:MAG: hypothetical protein ABR881_27375 [Candidatus Sulfotelmatobacter sp.]|jgi:hypothetical protein
MHSAPKTVLSFTLTALVAAGSLSFYSKVANAQSLPVSVSPARIEITAAPGGHVESSFKFWNGTDSDLPIEMQAIDVAQEDEEGHALAGGAEAAANSLKDWITPEYPGLSVAPKQEITLPFSIDVPANADPGSHWGALVAVTAPSPGGSSGAAVQVRTGVILLVRVLGDAKEELTLESFSLPRFLQSPPISFAARFRNEGTVHEAPAGNIEVRNILGMLVATGTLPVRNVLPGMVRRVDATVGDGFWLGRYTVLLSATYGDAGQQLVARSVVWVVPWRKLWPWMVLILVLLALFFVARKRLSAAWYVLRTGKVPPA